VAEAALVVDWATQASRWCHHPQVEKKHRLFLSMNINLACGRVFSTDTAWLNLDYATTSSALQRANLLGRLPLADATEDLVYSSYFLIANIFAPVVACHLPQRFHLSIGWDQAMRAMGLQPLDKVQYGRRFGRTDYIGMQAATRADALARRIYSWVQFLPKGRTLVGRALINLASSLL